MIYALSLGAMTLVATVIAGRPFVELLRRRKAGKEVSEWGPQSHQAKAGTPTMGGLLIMAAVIAFTAAASPSWAKCGSWARPKRKATAR